MGKVAVFHGADHKNGVTMVSQSVAELAAEQGENLRVLFIVLNGRINNQFLKDDIRTVDDFKLQMESRFIKETDFARECRYRGNLFVLGGLKTEAEERFYFPENVKYLIETVKGEFDLVICDTGACLDSGLAVGGMEAADLCYAVISQEESAIERYMKKIPICEEAGFNFKKTVVNKFREEDSYSKRYMSERLGIGREKLFFVRETENGRQAEKERKSLLEKNEEGFGEDIMAVANDILGFCGLPLIKSRRKNRKWISFI